MSRHEQAILELSPETLAREILLGFDIDTIEMSVDGGYKISAPAGPLSPEATAEVRFWGSSRGDALLRRTL